jgi:hypothetical protein
MPVRPLSELLSQGALGDLAGKAAERRNLTERVRAALPAEAGGHLLGVTELADGGLELHLDSSAWAARIRYELPRLGARIVTVKVRPRSPEA